ncbi:unnamed protein product [Rotaria sp. Silwood1]|nr:unnamed protein product [Rotaria sp. Silwood1]CAF1061630.1 unnamed protein product [Rotaria sp. Silwood1]
MTINRSWLDGVWHGWGHTSFTWPIQLTVDSRTNSYILDYVGLGGKSRLERLEELDQEVYFREHLIEGENFSDQDLFIIYKIDENRLEFIAFDDKNLSISTNNVIGTGIMPAISYLTSMDKYAIMCIFHLVILCIWHAILGSLIYLLIPDLRVTNDMWLAYIDQWVFMIAISIFVIIHIILLIWLYLVPLKHRREMAKKDLEYQQSMSKEKKILNYTLLSI